jgi:hypothetical protein
LAISRSPDAGKAASFDRAARFRIVVPMPISANHALHHLRPLHSEWGLSLLLEPQRGDEKRTFLLDFG